jgi:hypothetical protein
MSEQGFNFIERQKKKLAAWEERHKNFDVYKKDVKSILQELISYAPNYFPDIPWNSASIEHEDEYCVIKYGRLVPTPELIGTRYEVNYSDVFCDTVVLDGNVESHMLKVHDSIFVFYLGVGEEIRDTYSISQSAAHLEKVRNELFDTIRNSIHSQKDSIIMAIDSLVESMMDIPNIQMPYKIQDNYAELGSPDIEELKQDVATLFRVCRDYVTDLWKNRDGKNILEMVSNCKTKEEFEQINRKFNEARYVSLCLKLLADKLYIYSKLCRSKKNMDDELAHLKVFSDRIFIVAYLIEDVFGEAVYGFTNEDYVKVKDFAKGKMIF